MRGESVSVMWESRVSTPEASTNHHRREEDRDDACGGLGGVE